MWCVKLTRKSLLALLTVSVMAQRAWALVPTLGRCARSGLLRRMSHDDAFADYSSATTFLFPGQGAQSLGMGAAVAEALPAAKALYDQASEILGYDLLAKCIEGPREELDSTAVSQPAIFVSSMAAVEKLRAEEPAIEATCAMGLSLGEYSALCYAGALSFEDGVVLTKLRGEAMQAAADATPGSMVSVIGLDKVKVAEICAKAAETSGEPIRIANFLCNGNYAVSGGSKACDVVEAIAKPDFGARMTVRLAVAGAFHTDFMAPAVDTLKAALDDVDLRRPRIPVVSNVDAMPHADPAVIKDLLAQQVTSPVLWEDACANVLQRGFLKGYELGPNKVIAGIFKRIDKTAEVINVAV